MFVETVQVASLETYIPLYTIIYLILIDLWLLEYPMKKYILR